VSSETIVIVERPRHDGTADLRGESREHRDAADGLDRSAFVTVVRVQESEGERRTVGEVLARSVGVTARSMGGLGAFTSISVRGADAGHTAVLVDGLPLSRIASVTADLGQFELGSFETVELYRGGVPPELGGAGVGGAVNLITALGVRPGAPALQLSAGMGSFGAQHLRARWLGGERGGDRAYQVSVGYSGADGDFSFFDDGRTPLNASDDTTEIRQNNGYDRFDLLGRMRQGRWTFGSRTSLQAQGLPGDSHLQAADASLTTLHELVDANYVRSELFGGKGTASARGFASIERQHFADPNDEIGLAAQDAVYRTTSTGAATSIAIDASPAHQVSANLSARLDWFRDDPVGESVLPPSAGNRQSSSLAVSEHYVALRGRLFFDVGVRGDLLRTQPSRDVFSSEMSLSEAARTEWFLSPRASGRLRLGQSVAVKASVGRYLRVPTLIEAFGDRGFLLGNSELREEVGVTGDGGIVWAPAHSLGVFDRIYLEAVAFASVSDDPIVFVNRNGLVAQAINIDGASTLGSEVVGSIRLLQSVTLTSNYSLLASSNKADGAANGNQLPGRPRHRLYGRIDAAWEPWGHLLVLWGDALRQSGNFVDELNIYELPARSLFGVGAKVAATKTLLVGIEVKNAANVRQQSVELDPAPSDEFRQTPRALSDLHGYPLPGRSLYINLQWNH
tara:strand:+ start:2754 stop:4793 length:2040 start_codon:yes stop_codon:yes gene_type:complete